MAASAWQYNLEQYQLPLRLWLWFHGEVLKRPDLGLRTQIEFTSNHSLLFRQHRDHHGLRLSRDSVFFGYVWPLSQAPHHHAWEKRVRGEGKGDKRTEPIFR